ncbi:hypothetical protein HQ590_02595 [bacterium]|nr:hypothetical protein [bacterium]
MNEQQRISRRQFLRRAVVHAGWVAAAGTAFGVAVPRAGAAEPAPATEALPSVPAVPDLPKVKYRRLGRTNIEISEIAAGADSVREDLPFLAAWQAGVNYFHKADAAFGAPRHHAVLLQNRERIYLDVVIDQLDEQKAYEEFENKRQRIGTEYVDFFKVHSTWNTVEEFQTRQGPIRAFERLKKEKKTRWLALSKHGANTPEVLTAAMQSGLFDAIQPAVPGPEALAKLLAVARAKDVGVILMKTGGGAKANSPELARFGDPAKPFQTYYRYLLSQPGVTSIVAHLKNLDHLRENLGASGAPLDQGAADQLDRALAAAPVNYRDCIACGQCHGDCPDALPVADIMRYRLYAEDHHDWGQARTLYQELPARWRATVATGEGLRDQVCPHGLPLTAELKRAHRWLA